MKKKKVLIAIGAAVLAVIGILSVVLFQRGQNEGDEPLDNEPTQDPTDDGDINVTVPPISEPKDNETEKPDLDVSTMERPVAPGVSDVTIEYSSKEGEDTGNAE